MFGFEPDIGMRAIVVCRGVMLNIVLVCNYQHIAFSSSAARREGSRSLSLSSSAKATYACTISHD